MGTGLRYLRDAGRLIRRPPRPGLRSRVVLTFALGALLISLVLSVSVFTISRGYLLEQRERSAGRQAGADADLVRDRLSAPDVSAAAVLTALDPPADTAILLRWRGQWFASEPGIGPFLISDTLRGEVEGGTAAVEPVTLDGQPHMLAGVPISGIGDRDERADLYEFAPLVQLQSTLRVLSTVLASSALVATLGSAALGFWASRRVLQPLRTLTATAGRIAGGDIDIRLEHSDDPDLTGLVTSFNSMVDSLQRRIEHERRFVGDVSHELRTPLTTLVTSVAVLERHRAALPERAGRALGLVTTELHHFRRLLEDLLTLARTEAGLHQDDLEPVSLAALLTHTLARSGRPASLLTVRADATVRGRKPALERAFVNLMDNADRHGRGLLTVTVIGDAELAVIQVDDSGPGVPAAEQDRIFDRFTTGGAARGSTAGTGLGLALVAETIAAHGGQVRYEDRIGGGARLTVTLPVTDASI